MRATRFLLPSHPVGEGRGRRPRGEGALRCGYDCLKNAVRVLRNVVVPETQNAKAAPFQINIARLIVSTFRVLAPICLNDKHVLERYEIGDPGTDRDLTAEFYVFQLSGAKLPPELSF